MENIDNFENINKISILGGPGTGKSTLADNLGKNLKLPIYHLDGIHHLANWEKRDEKERDKIIFEIIEKPKWVIDGTYKSTIETRIKKTEMIIFLDYSTIAKLKGIMLRYIKNRGKEKPEIPGCKEKMEAEFVKYTLQWNKKTRKIVMKVLEENKNKKIIIFKSRKKLNKWYEKLFNKKMDL